MEWKPAKAIQWDAGFFLTTGLRDPGFQLRGYAANVQYDFFDTETGSVFPGTAPGQKKILAIDVGGDQQGAYRGHSAHVACDQPVHGGDEIGGQFQYFH